MLKVIKRFFKRVVFKYKFKDFIDDTTDSELCRISKKYSIKNHKDTNHLYDEYPYDLHLLMVYKFAKKYSYILKDLNLDIDSILSSAFTHDLIEDCRLTYNDISKDLTPKIADITYNLTNEKGKTRSERANDVYYECIRKDIGSNYIKVCDRLANVTYSKYKKSSMFNKYKTENNNFNNNLYRIELDDMFRELDSILTS